MGKNNKIVKNLLANKTCNSCLCGWQHLGDEDDWEYYCAFVSKYWHPKENTCEHWVKGICITTK